MHRLIAGDRGSGYRRGRLRIRPQYDKEKEELLLEIEATNNLLKKLQEKAKAPQWKFASMEKSDGPLQLYRGALEEAQEKLRPARTRLGKAVKRAVRHFQKGEFVEILSHSPAMPKPRWATLPLQYLDWPSSLLRRSRAPKGFSKLLMVRRPKRREDSGITMGLRTGGSVL
jgi:hypothetical protein